MEPFYKTKKHKCSLPLKDSSYSLWIYILFILFSLSASGQNTYTVNSTGDTEDIDLADNKCEDSNGNCTLRAAIQNANKSSEKDKINFKIPGTGPFTIFVKKNLPYIKETVELNATEMSDFIRDNPQIVLDGTGINPDFTGRSEDAPQAFRLIGESSGSTIKGFSIVGFLGFGIFIFTDKNIIQSNLIGLTADGRTNQQRSIGIIIKGRDNLIGGRDKEDRNVISGTGVGVFVYSRNQVLGNYIGTTADGCSSIANKAGIVITRYSEHNLISNNLISGNDQGIELSGDYNIIIRNRIGTNAAGTEKIPNRIGIRLSGAVSNSIGQKNKGNIISANEIGIVIEDREMSIDQNNKISNNFIGTDITGNYELGNETGILIKGGNVNWIGGFQKGDGNLISGNTSYGIEIRDTQETIIAGNNIGTNKDGTMAIPNGCGIILEGDFEETNCINNSIISNLISGNSGNGIEIYKAEYNSITGNFLGTQKDGVSPLPNGGNGIVTGSSAQKNCIGGPKENQQNIIKFNRKNWPEPLLMTTNVKD